MTKRNVNVIDLEGGFLVDKSRDLKVNTVSRVGNGVSKMSRLALGLEVEERLMLELKKNDREVPELVPAKL